MNPLFALLWASETEAAALAATLSESEWIAITRQAAQHRLRPLLHHRGASGGWSPPETVQQQWPSSHQRAGVRALGQRAELRRIGAAFATNGIASTALKGGAFLWSCCPDPSLRPLRDLDLLITPDAADKAASVLEECGFAPVASTQPVDAKHLIPMIRGQVAVELHLHMFETSGSASVSREAEFMERVWLRARPSMIAPGLLEPSATDTLFHLILHAVLDHQFNNGPLLIADMAWLIRAELVDWELLWSEAKALDTVRACQLALGMVRRLPTSRLDGWVSNRMIFRPPTSSALGG